MRLHQRTMIVVVVLFALLAALVYLVEMRPGQETPVEEEDRVAVFSFEVGEAVLLEVDDLTSNESVAVTKGGGESWRMTDPFEAEADDQRITGLLARLSSMQSTRVIEGEDVDLNAFGLAEPLLRVAIGLDNEERQVLLVGRENPAGYSHYVQREGEGIVYLVGSSIIGDLDRLLSDPPEKPTPVPTQTSVPVVFTETPTAILDE